MLWQLHGDKIHMATKAEFKEMIDAGQVTVKSSRGTLLRRLVEEGHIEE